MGIVYNPDLYRADEKWFAPYKMPAFAKNPWQTWHTDFVFDNGWCGSAMFSFTGPVHCVLLTLVDPDGKITETMQFIDDEDLRWAVDAYDIHLGPNYFAAKFPILEMVVDDQENDAGLNLKAEALIEPTLSELPDGVGIGRLRTPHMPVSVSWYFMPWNKITGTIKVNGETIPVSGYGWSDHQFGTDNFFGAATHYFYWANFPIGGPDGENLITIFEAQGGPEQGYRPIKWMWNFKNGKIYSYDRDADFYIFAEDIPEGDTVPHTMRYVFEGSRIRGIIEGKWIHTMMKQPVDQDQFHAMLNRSLYDCHAEIEIDGEKNVTDFKRVLEVCYTYEPTADQRLAYKGEAPAAAPVAAEEAPAPAPEAIAAPKVQEAYVDDGRPSLFSTDSKLGEVIAHPLGQAILEKYVPGITNDPNTKLGFRMKLKTLFAIPKTGVSKEQLIQMDEELRRIKE